MKQEKRLSTRLNSVQNFLNNIPNINYGGCGISALAMYLYSEKNFGIKPKIFFIYTDWECDNFEYIN